MIIDFHAYLGRDPFGDYVQTADELIALMDAVGIETAVVTPLVDSPGPDPLAHQVLEESRQRFGHRLVPFARVDPRYETEALQTLERLADEWGFRGLFYSPASTNTPPYHPAVRPIMQAAADRDIPVLVPAGHVYTGLPEHIAWLAASLPELTVIIGHMGTAAHALRSISLAAKYPNLYLETSIQQSTRRVSLAVEEAGADSVLFGSASPYGHPAVELLKIRKAHLDANGLTKVLGTNAARILRLSQEMAEL